MTIRFLLPALAGLLVGCASDLDVDPTNASTIEPGVTTKQEVRERFGEPRSVTQLDQDGGKSERWGYQTRRGKHSLVIWEMVVLFTNDVVSAKELQRYHY